MTSLSNIRTTSDLDDFKDFSDTLFVPVQDLPKDALQTLCDIVGINSYQPLSLSDTKVKIKEETVDIPQCETISSLCLLDSDSADVKVYAYSKLFLLTIAVCLTFLQFD